VPLEASEKDSSKFSYAHVARKKLPTDSGSELEYQVGKSSVSALPKAEAGESKPSEAEDKESLTTQQKLSDLNPSHFDLSRSRAKFFIIRCPYEDDIYLSFTYGSWGGRYQAQTHIESLLEQDPKLSIYLLFFPQSLDSFSGMAVITSRLKEIEKLGEYKTFGRWSSGFDVKWIFIKDIPASEFERIDTENPIYSRHDATEIPFRLGAKAVCIICKYRSETSVLSDSEWHKKRFEERMKLGPNPVFKSRAHYRRGSESSSAANSQDSSLPSRHEEDEYSGVSRHDHALKNSDVLQVKHIAKNPRRRT